MIQGKEREKKIKPLKQPTKPARTLLTTNKQPVESHLQHSLKDSMPKSKIPSSMVASQP